MSRDNPAAYADTIAAQSRRIALLVVALRRLAECHKAHSSGGICDEDHEDLFQDVTDALRDDIEEN